MRTKIWLAAAIGAPLAMGAAWAPVDENNEPPSHYTITLGDTDVPVLLDRPVDVEVNGAKTRLLLRVKPYRVLDLNGVRFRYPRAMQFKVQTITSSFKMWTLSGNDAVVIVQRGTDVDVDEARETVIEEMVARWGTNLQSREDASITLAGRKATGERFRISIADQTIEQSVYALDVGSAAFVLILQDSIDDQGKPSEDARRTFRMLRESFAITGDGR